MKIFITAFTAGRGGNGLIPPLRYFNKYIETTFLKNGFTSSFTEFSIRFSYLPLYVLPGMAGTENVFMEYYNQLPECRINRRYQRIETAVKAPQFSEHFDKKDQFKYKHKFDIAEKYKNLSDVQLAGIVIDKLLEAAELARPKLKKNDVFDFGLFEEILTSIKQSITTGLLEKINKEEESNSDEKQVALVNQSRADRKLTRAPADKLIRKGIAGKNIEEIYFTVIDKQKKRMAKWKVGEEHIFTVIGWFSTLTVTNKSIRTKPRANMDLVLKGKQKEFEIDIEKVLAGQ